MKISLNAIKWHGYDDLFKLPIDQLADKIGSQLGALEEAPYYLGGMYDGIVVVKVVECHDHPDADKLRVCLIDDGGIFKGVERNSDGYVQVVCGAPNVKTGMLVAWLPPGSTVPSSVGKEPFILTSRDFRGVKSNGMLASPSELAITDNHEGLLEIKPEEVGEDLAKPGTPLKQLFGLDDYILNIENKMFTHRPDCFGLLGVGREIAGIQSIKFSSPEWYVTSPAVPTISDSILSVGVKNEVPELVKRFVIVPMSNVIIHESPVWLQSLLARSGIRPINNVVDITNYYMLLTGQPLHAYDYDKVKALSGGGNANIVVRNPRPGEKLELLNGKTIEPRGEAVMIATDTTLIGVGGVMGGGTTEVDDNTKNILLECANFDMYSIRRTSMTHGLFTDAVSRFNKGQSPLQNMAVALKAAEDISNLSGAKIAGPIIDDNHLDASVIERQSLRMPVKVTAKFINDRLGLDLKTEEMTKLLENVEFKIETNGEEFTVTPPFWRTDIELREDVVEEVGRLYGYDKLPLDLPLSPIDPTRRDAVLELKNKIRLNLSKAGANELLTYSFIHSDLLNKVRQDADNAFKLSNALSPELQYYRLSLTPSLLEKVHPNIKAGYDRFALFEMGKVHDVKSSDSDGLPAEMDHLSLVIAADSKSAKKHYEGAAYYSARYYLNQLLSDFGINLELLKIDDNLIDANPSLQQLVRPFEPLRSAFIKINNDIIGVIGEYRSGVKRLLKLPDYCAGFELSIDVLAGKSKMAYKAPPKYPKVSQDMTLKVKSALSHNELYEFCNSALNDNQPEGSLSELNTMDIFQKPDDQENKQISMRLNIANYDRTLTDKEVNTLLDKVAELAGSKFGAERI